MRRTFLFLCACALGARASDCEDPWEAFPPEEEVLVREQEVAPPRVREEVTEDGTRVVTVERGDYLAGAEHGCAPVSVVHEMTGPADDVHVHLAWPAGLYRISPSGRRRGTASGVRIEWCDAAAPPHPRRNPWRPAAFQREGNEGWTDRMDGLAEFPCGVPGFWYTHAASPCRVDRTILYRFARPGRYRLRLSGVMPDSPGARRAPTLAALTELAFPRDGEAPPAPPPAPPEEQEGGDEVRAVLEPRRPFVFETEGAAEGVELRLVFPSGLHARAGDGALRECAGGLLLEYCEADRPPDPESNPWQRAFLQARDNPEWRNPVPGLAHRSNGVPGYWFTTARSERPVERRLVFRFPAPGRWRVRVTGAFADDDRHARVPALAGVVELGVSPERDGVG